MICEELRRRHHRRIAEFLDRQRRLSREIENYRRAANKATYERLRYAKSMARK